MATRDHLVTNQPSGTAAGRGTRVIDGVTYDLDSHPMDVSKLGLEDSPIVRLQDGRVGTKEELGIIVPRREGQVDSEPSKVTEEPKPTRADRVAELEQKFNATFRRTPVHENYAAQATGQRVELVVNSGSLKGTVIAVEGTDINSAVDQLEAKATKVITALSDAEGPNT